MRRQETEAVAVLEGPKLKKQAITVLVDRIEALEQALREARSKIAEGNTEGSLKQSHGFINDILAGVQ